METGLVNRLFTFLAIILTLFIIFPNFLGTVDPQAADVPLAWDAATGATSYKLQMSLDQGVTWPQEKTVTTGTTYTWVGVPDTGLVLFRAISVNSQGVAMRTEAGAWYNGTWRLPTAPGGLGAK
jgi:F0F1-type ATP synthase membrane subunit a